MLSRWQFTHWGRVKPECLNKLTIISSDNGLSPARRQAIIWTNAGILSIGALGTNLSEIVIDIHRVSFMKMHLKMSPGKWHHFVSASMSLYNTTFPTMWYYTTITKAFHETLLLAWCYSVFVHLEHCLFGFYAHTSYFLLILGHKIRLNLDFYRGYLFTFYIIHRLWIIWGLDKYMVNHLFICLMLPIFRQGIVWKHPIYICPI